VALCTLAASGARAQVAFEALALSSQAAPGAGGAVFGRFSPPSVNAAGDLAFHGEFEAGVGGVDQDNDTSIWVLPEGGTLTLRAREGSPIETGAPPGDEYGHIFSSFGHPRIDATGQVAFRGRHRRVTATQFTDYGALYGPGVVSGSLKLVATSSPFAGSAPGVTGSFASFEPPAMNTSGQLAFVAGLAGTGIGGNNDSGVWLSDAGNVTLFHQEGDPAPGQPGNTMHQAWTPLQIDASGTPGFRAMMTGPGVDEYSRDVIWGPDENGVFGLRVQTAQTTPPGGAPGDILISISVPRMNDGGHLSFSGRVGPFGAGPGVSTTFRSDDNAVLQQVAQQGSPPPGFPAGAEMGVAGVPLLNSSGQAVFSSDFTNAAESGDGLWGPDGYSEYALLARSGDRPAGLPVGVVLEDLDTPIMSDQGDIVFAGLLASGGASPSNDLVLVTVPFGGPPTLIVREGDAFEVASGDVRTISDIAFIPSTLADPDHRHQVQDDTGRVSFLLEFSDGSSGLFRATAARQVAEVPIASWLSVPLTMTLAWAGAYTLQRRSRGSP
jgi:hypothetical protein